MTAIGCKSDITLTLFMDDLRLQWGPTSDRVPGQIEPVQISQSTSLLRCCRIKGAKKKRSILETWVTDYSGDIGNTFALNGFSMGTNLVLNQKHLR
jgi:hypothetical protein